MTRDELLRILSFVDQIRNVSERESSLSGSDPRWNILSYAMRRHLEGKLITINSAVSAAGVPYGTARRRLNDLLEEGLLLKRPRSVSGKSVSLHPSRRLIEEFETLAMSLKSVVGTAFGFTADGRPIEDLYFGGSYMTSRILSYPMAMRAGIGFDRKIRILSPIDPTFRTLSDESGNLNELCGTIFEIVNLPLAQLHDEIIAHHARGASDYDIIAIDLPWIGELADGGVIRPIDDILSDTGFDGSDFHTAAWRGSSWAGRHYGLPIQPTPELLFCREDLLGEAGIALPETAEEVLEAARRLHRSRMNLAGIVMNFGRGIPVAHSFVQTLASFGQPIIALDRLGDEFDLEHLAPENYRPMVDSEAGRATAEFLLELRQFSHRESLSCDWDKRIAIFSKGEAAMTFGWSIRAAKFELDPMSPAHGKVAFLPNPPAAGAQTVSPLGGFALAMPAGLPEPRVRQAWKAMEYLTRPELLKWYVQNGNLTSPRFSTSADPEVQAISRMIGAVDAMERRGELQIWPRPPVPEFQGILDVLGQRIYLMLQGAVSVTQSLKQAQSDIDAIMRDAGRY